MTTEAERRRANHPETDRFVTKNEVPVLYQPPVERINAGVAIRSVLVRAELDRLHARAEKAERAAAAMREALDALLPTREEWDFAKVDLDGEDGGTLYTNAGNINAAFAALASDAGKGFLSREQAREVARRVWGECSGSGTDDGQVLGIDEVIDEVLRA